MWQKILNCKCLDSWRDWSYLFLRVVVGAVFFMHGYQKLTQFTIPGVAQNLITGGLGWQFPMFWAYLLTYGELIGGAFLILGLFTHWAAKISAFIAFVALIFIHLKGGFFLSGNGYEYILTLLAASIYLMSAGAGKYSLDKMWRNKDSMM
ncbi:MAG: DoxX family protein [Patescibacteria group bacterium]